MILDAGLVTNSIVKVFRRGGKTKQGEDSSTRPRVLKVKTVSEDTRNLLLKYFRRQRPDASIFSKIKNCNVFW
jgi:hypothetical protein